MSERLVPREGDIVRQRIRLALINMAVLAVIWTVLAGLVYSLENRHQIREVDHQLMVLALRIQQQSCPPRCRPVPLFERDPITLKADVHYFVWAKSGMTFAFQPFVPAGMNRVEEMFRSHPPVKPTYYFAEISKVPYRALQMGLKGQRTLQIFENIQDDQSRLGRLLVWLGLGGAIGLVLSVRGGFLLGLWTLKPILAARRREQELLSDVSHELRTPLSVVTTHAELLVRHASDPIADHLPWLEAIYSETNRMSRLVRDLLEIRHLEQGARSLNLEVISLRELLRTVEAIYRPVLEEAGLSLTVTIPRDAFVRGDALRLRQLLLIFLDNARKYTPAGGIDLRLGTRGNLVEIHIQDTGPGMDPHLLSAPDRFFRGGRPRVGAESTGLGLAIAQGIIRAHRGKLAIRSLPGVGTDIIISLRMREVR